MQTLIIIPTYNERESLKQLAEQVFTFLPETDILIVDDNSPDGTGDLAAKLSKKHQRIKLIRREGKLGLGSAYLLGFKYALEHNYDLIFEMDADFSHHPRYLPQFLTAASRYNLVLGSRYIKGGKIVEWSAWRRLISLLANLYARTILGLPFRDLTGGFKCFRREVLQDLALDSLISEGYVFQIETTYRAYRKGYAIKEIPIIFTQRRKGKSKISRAVCLEAIWKIPLLRLCRF